MLIAESSTRSRIILPPVPTAHANERVAAWVEPVEIDSYLPAAPDAYPAFLDSRVYQGSSGRVYPLPFHERIAQQKVPHLWQAVHLENEWLRIMILPELGGRIHVAWDKVAEYDIFYRNNVIKPALVGLAGPWISGGVEFNWPQHHRPATFLPTDTSIEHEADGAITVWSSDHDPFARMKGMHGIRLRPDSSLIEARVRLYNRSEVTQSFLWWANVAAAVGDDYQSFFPTDVTRVADHARRAVTTFPRVEGRYYGVDYSSRVDADHPDGDRLDWYRNIPVPTSYMVLSTDDEFFGGYDHGRDAGFVHWASGDVSPGKKQWTWGNAEFGWAWDRNLTDDDGPYIELMAGVFTDNQPDFALLAPGETKSFSQFWYPIQQIGPVQQATLRAAASLTDSRVGVAVTSAVDARVLLVDATGATLLDEVHAITPGTPLLLKHGASSTDGPTLTVLDGDTELVSIAPRTHTPEERTAATEPPAPVDVATVEQLVLIGEYLERYRHATRSPEPYWREALTRDPGDARANIALGARRYSSGLFDDAIAHFETAVARETEWVPTPTRGEAQYRLGLALVRQGRDREARPRFARASWDAAWRVPATYALARLHSRAGEYELALEQLEVVASLDPQHLQAADLRVRVLRALGRDGSAILDEVLARDPLDQWALDLAGRELTRDAPTLLDIAIEYAGTGFTDDALRLLDSAEAADTALGQVNVGPLIQYHRAALLGTAPAVVDARNCLPSRLEDIAALQASIRVTGPDAQAHALLGHWFYDRGRHADAIASWTESLAAAPDAATRAIVERNLGVASYNVLRDTTAARKHYDAALAAAPDDSRLWFELDQLASRSGEPSSMRLARLDARRELVAERDDLTVVLANLLVDKGRAREALDLLADRVFQPWEGGEGQVIGAWDRATVALAGAAMSGGEPTTAVDLLETALQLPASVGEARHPLASNALLHLALGDAHAAIGRMDAATAQWRAAAESDGDFTGMRTRAYSAQTPHSVWALRRLGETRRADDLTAEFATYIGELAAEPATVDYFATSLPTMLLFTDDPQKARDREVAALRDALRRLSETARRDMTAPSAVETGWQ